MSGCPRILLVFADDMLRQVVAEHLRSAAGWTLGETRSVEGCLAMAAGHDLVVIDDSVAGSAEARRRLRSLGHDVPLLVLCAQDAADTEAEAVVTKPLRLGSLTARISELLARKEAVRDVAIGPWRFLPERRCLRGADGSTVRLTDKEVAILNRLARAGGAVVARETLLEEVWGYSAAITTHTLETHVYRLRRKIESETATSGLLVTEGGGYRLTVGS